MAKPICLVNINLSQAQNLSISDFQSTLSQRLNDYHVLVIPAKHDQEKIIEIEVFYDKDFTPAQFDDITDIILEKLNEIEKEKEIRDEDKTKEKTEPIY